MSIKYCKQNITKDHPRLVEPHQLRGDYTSLSDSLEPKKEIKTSLSSAVSLLRPGELNNPDMSIKCNKQNITKDHPRLVEPHQLRGDYTSLSDSLEPKKEIKTSLSSAMSLCRPGELNNPDMSIKCSKQNINKDHPRLVEPHQIRGDFTSLSDLLELKKETKTSLSSSVYLRRSEELNNPDISIK
jgi:uncharacterized Zn-finger protein